jgi:hypothetical protein
LRLKLAMAFAIWCGTATFSAVAQQPQFEVGVVARSESAGFFVNAYPVIDRLRSGRLVCVFSVRSDQPRKLKIAVETSDDGGKSWTAPRVIFDHAHAEDADPNLLVDEDRILAFSTTVPDPARIDQTLIYMRESRDGINWSDEVLLKTPHRYLAGKIHQGHRLSDGTLIVGYAWDTWAEQGMPPATEGEMDIKSGVLRSKDGGRTWIPGGDLYAVVPKTSPHSITGLDEPATAVLHDDVIFALMRASGTKLYNAWSHDGGLSWDRPQPSTLSAHNSPAALWKVDHSGDLLVAWDNSTTGRTPLTVALSADEGHSWSAPRVIVDTSGPEQVSYPSAVQAKDGTMIVVWQQDLPQGAREVRIARFNRAWLLAGSRVAQ